MLYIDESNKAMTEIYIKRGRQKVSLKRSTSNNSNIVGSIFEKSA